MSIQKDRKGLKFAPHYYAPTCKEEFEMNKLNSGEDLAILRRDLKNTGAIINAILELEPSPQVNQVYEYLLKMETDITH